MIHFIYTKSFNIASENGFYIDEIVDWFSRLDISDIWNDLKEGGFLSPSELTRDLLENASKTWVNEFREWCEFTEEENKFLSDDELITQVSDYIRIPLEQYYIANWKDLEATYDE